MLKPRNVMNRKAYNGKITPELIEEGTQVLIDFEKLKKVAASPDPVVPVAVQDNKTKEVLIIAYANEQALKHTLEHKVAAFWSTSRQELWVKGMTSGDQLNVVGVYVNCEQNSLLYVVEMVGKGSCHTKKEGGQTRFGCYYRRISGDKLVFTDQ